MTRDDIRWRPIPVLVGGIAALLMVVNAVSGGPLLTEVQLWSLLVAIPGTRVFLEAWVRFVEPRDVNGLTLAFVGLALVAVATVTGAPVLDVFGYGLVTLGMVTSLLTD